MLVDYENQQVRFFSSIDADYIPAILVYVSPDPLTNLTAVLAFDVNRLFSARPSKEATELR